MMLVTPSWSMPRKLCGARAEVIASMAICRLPSVAFLNPTGIDKPLAISRWVCDSVVRAPIAAQLTRSAMYWGTMGSRNSVADGRPIPVICRSNCRFLQTHLDVVGAVEMRVVNQPLPANGRPRFLEIDAHDNFKLVG